MLRILNLDLNNMTLIHSWDTCKLREPMMFSDRPSRIHHSMTQDLSSWAEAPSLAVANTLSIGLLSWREILHLLGSQLPRSWTSTCLEFLSPEQTSVENTVLLGMPLANKMRFVEDGINYLHSTHLQEQTEIKTTEEPKSSHTTLRETGQRWQMHRSGTDTNTLGSCMAACLRQAKADKPASTPFYSTTLLTTWPTPTLSTPSW